MPRCEVCGRWFKNEQGLSNHMKRWHGAKLKNRVDELEKVKKDVENLRKFAEETIKCLEDLKTIISKIETHDTDIKNLKKKMSEVINAINKLAKFTGMLEE